MHKFQRAFTIVELLVVIVIIGILATVVITAFNGISGRAKDAALSSDLTQAKKQIEAFYAVNGVYPTANNCTNTAATEICLKTSPGNTLTYTFVSNTASPAYTLTGNSGVVPTTGGTVVDLNGYRYHVFTTSGTFTVGTAKTMQSVLVGGGGGGSSSGGGGGGGKLVTSSGSISAGTYSITVGSGGTQSTNGSASTALGLTAGPGSGATDNVGGSGGGSGGGAGVTGGYIRGGVGGSSGGAGGANAYGYWPGTGGGWTDTANLIGTFISAGSGGGVSADWTGGGGGGGVTTTVAASVSGGNGTTGGSPVAYGGGGYGGGGGGGYYGTGGAGAPGIVIIRYAI